MKILFMQWESAGQKDLEEALIQEGHEICCFSTRLEKVYGDSSEFEKQFSAEIQKELPDIVFTVNYHPIVSAICDRKKVRYVSWIYDSPCSGIYNQTVVNSCNIIYTLEKEMYQEFHQAGISTVHYLPMAANTERLDAIPSDLPLLYNVSFVGSLYLEKFSFNQLTDLLADYGKGYLDALVVAQLKIQGYDFVQEVLGPVMEDLCKAMPRKPIPGNLESDEFYYAQYYINPWITAVERIDFLESIAEKYGMDFFTYHDIFTFPNLRNHGFVDYHTEMPLVFKQSKINLNITRRGTKGSIPLRCFDIMGSKGFLLSNFQSELLDLFVPGEDFVYYESKEDLLQKIGYYLTHEEERQAIAKSGHDKVAAHHTYRHRVREMLDF